MAHDAYDLLDGTVSGFYEDVDNAIAASEVVKGQYRYTISPAYNSPNPVDSSAFTTVGLTQNGPMVVDLENSYITTEARILLTCSTKLLEGSVIFFGWKSSVEAIERYDILVNNTPIYTQSFCGEESFIQYQVLSDLVSHTTPFVYTTMEDVRKGSPNVCGVYVKVGASFAAGTDITFTVPIKIPLTNFLLLRNLKYLMSWMGKWELRLYFGTSNMIVYPLSTAESAAAFGTPAAAGTDRPKTTFYNVEDTRDYITEANTLGKGFMNKVKMTLNNVEMNAAHFQLRMDIMEMLKQKYLAEKPLTFPVSSLQIARFTGVVNNGTIAAGHTADMSIVLCQAINNCDTLFIIPFRNTFQHTCCENPQVSNLQLHAGEYGTYPNQPFNTYNKNATNNIRYINQVMDALNVNASPIISMNRAVANAFLPSLTLQSTTGMDVAHDKAHYLFTGDESNFFIPFPFSTDDDFQGGLSSPAANINFKLTGTIHNTTGAQIVYSTPWVAAFLIDGVIMIRPDPASDAAKVIWSDRTVC